MKYAVNHTYVDLNATNDNRVGWAMLLGLLSVIAMIGAFYFLISGGVGFWMLLLTSLILCMSSKAMV